MDDLQRLATEREKRPTEDAHEAKLQRKLAKARETIAELSKTKDEYAQRLQRAELKISTMEQEKATITGDGQALRRQFEREKKLAEASIQATKLAIESLYYQRLEEQRAKFGSEKREFFAKSIDTFRDFFNPELPLNDQTVAIVLGKAREELDRLSAADRVIRQLLDVSPRQKTDEAVAELLINPRD
jgi:hypothetical protein